LRQLKILRYTLTSQFRTCYSVKANPSQAILRFFVEEGCGLEIASSGELCQALAAGCPAEKILFAGPGKTERELALAIDRGIGEIHVESTTEARRIVSLAHSRGRRMRVSLRVNPSAAVEGGGMRMGAKSVPFGIDEEQLDSFLSEFSPSPSLEIVGLHLFVGTQILDHNVLLKQYRAGIEIARSLAAKLKSPLETVDFGGGLGIPYFANESPLDMDSFRLGLAELMRDVTDCPELSRAQFIVEPGRFLVGEAGVYVMRVNDVKVSRGRRFAIVDGGMHQHLAASGNLGQTIKRNFPVAVLNKLDHSKTEQVDVAGPLCTPLDTLARNIALPTVEVGDLIGVFQSGAYARSASPTGFLSRPAPAEVFVEQGHARLIRPHGRDEDYLADQMHGAPMVDKCARKSEKQHAIRR
jgi:diaminopimelate decarboxylase